MQVTLEIILGIILVLLIAILLYEYRFRQQDFLVLAESKGHILFRRGLLYPRHFSLLIPRSTSPIQMTVDAAAAGNLGIKVRLVGSTAPALDHLDALVRVGGWNKDALARSTDEVQVMFQRLVKEYSESREITALSSAKLLESLSEQATLIEEHFGVSLVTLTVQSLDPTDPEIIEALRQQEQARLIEHAEQLNQQARINAARLKAQADEEISQLDHALELKKVDMKQALIEKESALSQQRLSDELARSRMRLDFEKEELDALKKNPELLMLTPQAARLAEASQTMKNARTVISFNSQDSPRVADLLTLFQEFLQKALEAKKKDAPE